MGAWGTLKHTTNTKQSQKEIVGICINPRAAKSLWLCCARLKPQPQSTLGCPGRGVVALGPSLAPRDGNPAVDFHQPLQKGMCICHHRTCHDTEIIWVNQTFHGSGESRLWEEPQQKGMEAGRGERNCVGVLTAFFSFCSELKRTEVITKGILSSSLG